MDDDGLRCTVHHGDDDGLRRTVCLRDSVSCRGSGSLRSCVKIRRASDTVIALDLLYCYENNGYCDSNVKIWLIAHYIHVKLILLYVLILYV